MGTKKPASPCLSSRIPYGQEVSAAKLQQIEAGEAWLSDHGFPINRLRHYDQQALIEVPPGRVAELKTKANELTAALMALGFATVTIDDEGFMSGKLNRAIGRFQSTGSR